MMPRRGSAILAALLMLLTLAPALGGVRGLVFCVSSDGHMAIEASHEAPACGIACADDPEQRGMAECESCFDVALGAFELRAERVRTGPPQVEGEAAVPPRPGLLAMRFGAAQQPAGEGRPDAGSLPPPHLCALRTVNLRI